MTITVGENSYVTVAEADAYFAGRYGYDKWGTQTPEQREAALISAAQQMNAACNWYDSNYNFTFDPIAYPPPQELKDAQCEIAYAMVVSGSADPSTSDPLTELTAGDVTLKWNASSSSASPLYSDYTKGLLAAVGECYYGGGTRIVDVERAQ
jgi:hypothetical protein